jgi:hypothetical protein
LKEIEHGGDDDHFKRRKATSFAEIPHFFGEENYVDLGMTDSPISAPHVRLCSRGPEYVPNRNRVIFA